MQKNVEIPELTDLEKILYLGPSEIETKEIRYGECHEEHSRLDSMTKSIFAVLANESHAKSVSQKELDAYSNERYMSHIDKVSEALGELNFARAALNAARNRFQAAEILTRLEQSKMKIR